MSKTPWTPGPWRVDPLYPGDVQTADGRFEICTPWHVELNGATCFVHGDDISEETAKANARLIAAAPEMAEVLAELIAEGPDAKWQNARDPLRYKARALLARIRGDAT